MKQFIACMSLHPASLASGRPIDKISQDAKVDFGA